ncbi:MAG: hypothetical protein ABJD07_03110 [Gemmatimonadaceae bacterium]
MDLVTRPSVGTALIAGGAAIGIGAVIASTLGVHITLSPAMMQLALYKLAFGAAGGCMIAGALVRRRSLAREREKRELASPSTRELPPS